MGKGFPSGNNASTHLRADSGPCRNTPHPTGARAAGSEAADESVRVVSGFVYFGDSLHSLRRSSGNYYTGIWEMFHLYLPHFQRGYSRWSEKIGFQLSHPAPWSGCLPLPPSGWGWAPSRLGHNSAT